VDGRLPGTRRHVGARLSRWSDQRESQVGKRRGGTRLIGADALLFCALALKLLDAAFEEGDLFFEFGQALP
jgi:hypothetical protein